MNAATKTSAPAFAVETTDNRKLGPVSATYASQQSCGDCAFKDNGCYAEYGPVGFLTMRLNRAEVRSPVMIAKAEAAAIDRLTADRALRLHVVGDCRTIGSTRIVAAAAARYKRRGGRPVWTYTHAWRSVPRPNWGGVSVLASCETPGQAQDAMNLGYAAAVVVSRFESDKRYWYALPGVGGVYVVPCPYQTRRVTCRDCRLCFDDQRLLERRLVIGFEAHGTGAARVRQSLPVIPNPNHEGVHHEEPRAA